jgi:S1-C subfamily serine protease
VVIVAVEPGSPAAQANREQGDIILALDGEPVSSVDDLVRLLSGDRIGHSIELRLLKRGEMLAVILTPVERTTTAPGSR